MNKIILLLTCVLASTYAFASVNSADAVKTFEAEMGNIKSQLEHGQMNGGKAAVLLSAIQVRQNMVLIEQNQEIINLLKKETK